MTLTTFTAGTKAKASEVNANFNASMNMSLQNHVRQLIDRAVTYGADTKDIWGEAYITLTGRNTSISTANSTALYNGVTYTYQSIENITASGTTVETGVTNPTYAFDNDTGTEAELYEVNDYIGKTFSSQYVTKALILWRGAGSSPNPVKVQTYDGSTWSDVASYSVADAATPSWQEVTIGATVQGVRILNSDAGSDNLSVHEFLIGGETTETLIEHTIPTGKFSSTCSSAIIKALVANTESGASIQHKLTNASEDSGYFDDGEVFNFTAFTSEPTKIITKLTPKSTSPTAGYPAIYGVGVYVE